MDLTGGRWAIAEDGDVGILCADCAPELPGATDDAPEQPESALQALERVERGIDAAERRAVRSLAVSMRRIILDIPSQSRLGRIFLHHSQRLEMWAGVPRDLDDDEDVA